MARRMEMWACGMPASGAMCGGGGWTGRGCASARLWPLLWAHGRGPGEAPAVGDDGPSRCPMHWAQGRGAAAALAPFTLARRASPPASCADMACAAVRTCCRARACRGRWRAPSRASATSSHRPQGAPCSSALVQAGEGVAAVPGAQRKVRTEGCAVRCAAASLGLGAADGFTAFTHCPTAQDHACAVRRLRPGAKHARAPCGFCWLCCAPGTPDCAAGAGPVLLPPACRAACRARVRRRRVCRAMQRWRGFVLCWLQRTVHAAAAADNGGQRRAGGLRAAQQAPPRVPRQVAVGGEAGPRPQRHKAAAACGGCSSSSSSSSL